MRLFWLKPLAPKSEKATTPCSMWKAATRILCAMATAAPFVPMRARTRRNLPSRFVPLVRAPHTAAATRAALRCDLPLRTPRRFCLPALSWLAGQEGGSCCR